MYHKNRPYRGCYERTYFQVIRNFAKAVLPHSGGDATSKSPLEGLYMVAGMAYI